MSNFIFILTIPSLFTFFESPNILSIYDIAATKWRDSSTGQHVEYDQRPDMFRLAFV